MIKYLFIVFCFFNVAAFAQEIKLRKRNFNAPLGSQFAKSIADTNLSIQVREQLIYSEIRNGNIPSFLRKLNPIQVVKVINGKGYKLIYYTISDYLSIGENADFFYLSTTPMLAQKIADLTNSILPTKKMVDDIYANAAIKLEPQPIPPSKAMTTVPIFVAYNDVVIKQLESFKLIHEQSGLTAGNKKDIVISNKIFDQPTPRVVIYGWHKLNGQAIQPVYNKHTSNWADYSHGVRLISNVGYLNGKRTKLTTILKDPKLHVLLSDEGQILNSKYPLD